MPQLTISSNALAVAKNFSQMAAGSTDKIKGTVRNVALILLRKSKLLAPVDTGKLRQQIFLNAIGGGFKTVVSTNSDYAGFVHDGTRFIKPNPFMLKAVNQSEPQIRQSRHELAKKLISIKNRKRK